MEQYLWLIVLGVIIGAYGTLVGAGGGFVLVPLLLLLYPEENPEIITSITLAVVFFNSLSGSAAYARMKRIDFRSGALFSAASIPGAIFGALTTAYIPRQIFNAILGVVMIVTSVYLIVRPDKKSAATEGDANLISSTNLPESHGNFSTVSYNRLLGVIVSFFVGYLSTVLGIGGGIIHVPVLVNVLNFPVHIASATSHFILAIISFTGTVVHIVTGTFTHGIHRTIALSIGVIPGAQIGALLSNRFSGIWILRGLGLALGFVGIRILLMVL